MLNVLTIGMICVASLTLAPDKQGGADAVRAVRWVLSSENVPNIDDGLPARWEKRAREAQSALEKFDARLALANWLLSRQICAPVSRVLLNIEEPTDAKQIATVVATAQDVLKEADRLWVDVIASGELPKALDSKRAKHLAGLKIFADVFAAIWIEAEDAREESMRSAANQLSVLLQDERTDVLAGAQLWQGVLYVRRGKLKGALELMPRTLEPLTKPRGVTLYTRLVQCRTVFEQDQAYAAVVALLLNLEDVAVRRIADAQKGVEAQAAVALLRREILTQWRKQLGTEGELDRAAWCSRKIEALDMDHDPGSGVVAVLPMEFAAPEFVDLEKAIAQLDKPPGAAIPLEMSTNGSPEDEQDAGDAAHENPGG